MAKIISSYSMGSGAGSEGGKSHFFTGFLWKQWQLLNNWLKNKAYDRKATRTEALMSNSFYSNSFREIRKKHAST